MANKKRKKYKLLKGEICMYVLLVFLLLAIPIFNVYTSGMLSETNTKVERLKSQINKQEKTNQSLSMQVDELVSLENIQNIAEQFGLSYINGNIKSIGQD
ncbi:MAG: hypothetical protein K2M17_00045 [Bacilli bacterium]|nr:hypothetical protein [Bacilli bacterium]